MGGGQGDGRGTGGGKGKGGRRSSKRAGSAREMRNANLFF